MGRCAKNCAIKRVRTAINQLRRLLLCRAALYRVASIKADNHNSNAQHKHFKLAPFAGFLVFPFFCCERSPSAKAVLIASRKNRCAHRKIKKNLYLFFTHSLGICVCAANSRPREKVRRALETRRSACSGQLDSTQKRVVNPSSDAAHLRFTSAGDCQSHHVTVRLNTTKTPRSRAQ